jgi:4-hydroxy-2-oxoglutarate aldolase
MSLWKLLNISKPTEAEAKEAARLQAVLSNADVAAVPGGIRAMSKSRNLNFNISSAKWIFV